MLHLLQVVVLWQAGTPGAADEIPGEVANTLGCLEVLATVTGQSFVFPKAHGLRHIARDVQLFGSAGNGNTGA
jgi:hypothetical protein